MVILFDTLSILPPATVLENCLETPGLKPFSTFVELFQLYLFVTIANVVGTLNHIFFLLGERHPLFPCVDCFTCPSIFQWHCPLNFVWLPHNALFCFLLFHTLLLFFVDCQTFLPLFLSGTVPLIFVWMSHMRASIFLCECHTNILVSPLLLSGHCTLFLFRS